MALLEANNNLSILVADFAMPGMTGADLALLPAAIAPTCRS
ncbi:hypothetical protein [Azospirillum argentinense]|uniref:Response regulatory domain-containing protein n=1 Tax=Azospirillum argentinense TaxID=2970906 RepID=A0ABW8VCW2_9PROT|nr:hypothetical protein [Azospirillum argentinense]